MPTVGQIRTGLTPLLDGIVTQLTTFFGWPTSVTTGAAPGSSRILVIAREIRGVPHFQGDQDILIRPGQFVSLEPYAHGAGRIDMRIRRIIHVGVRNRRQADEGDRDYVWLTDKSGIASYLALEEGVIAALEQFSFYDVQGNVLDAEPMRLYTGDAAIKEAEDMKAWGFGVLNFELVYQLAINPLQPPNWP